MREEDKLHCLQAFPPDMHSFGSPVSPESRQAPQEAPGCSPELC